jgi:D-threo-aldose 1-dehydrogenase
MEAAMMTRRKFISSLAVGAAMVAAAPLLPGAAQAAIPEAKPRRRNGHYVPGHTLGIGGVAIGNGFKKETTDAAAEATLEAAWNGGIRYFDTSPFYGYGLSERRFGHFLHNKKREDFVLSTKVGRIFTGSAKPHDPGLWGNPDHFEYRYDYTADGVRRAVEDSLQRLGLSSIDIVYIHDLSPDNKELGGKWMEYFDLAAKGAMPALTKMREEGMIKGWGLGVNTPEPILKTLEVADPDIFLAAAINYQMMSHEYALNRLFPACDAKGVSIVVGSPLAAGFLAGRDRYLYDGKMPSGYKEKRAKMESIAKAHNTDLRTAALQFAAAPPTVASIIPGAREPKQVEENIASMKTTIPANFWAELKKEKLIAENAPVPA